MSRLGTTSLRRLLSNWLYLAMSSGVTLASGVLVTVIAARYLGVADFGKWGTVLALITIMTAVRGGGGTYIMRETAKDPSGSGLLLSSGVVGVGMACALISTVGYCLFVLLFHGVTGLDAAYWCAALGMTAACLVEVPISILAGKEQMAWRFSDAAQGIVYVLLLVLAVRMKAGINGVAASLFGSYVLVTAFMYMLARKHLPHLSKPSSRAVIAVLHGTIAMGLVSGSQVLHWAVDTYLLQYLSGSFQVGLFNAAFKMFIVARTVPWLLAFGLLPMVSRLAAQNDLAALRAIVAVGCKYLTIAGLLLSLFFIVATNDLVNLFYGPKFAATAGLFRILVWGIIPMLLQWVYWNVLVSVHKERQVAYAYLGSIVGQILLDFALIPAWGAAGAAFSFVVSEWVVLLSMFRFGAIHVRAGDWKSIAKPVACSLPALCLVQLKTGLPAAVALLAAAGLSCVALLLTRTVRRKDFDILVQPEAAQ